MNQDQVKEKMLLLEEDVPEFTLIFSGKASKRVNGLYKPDSCEIIIHNRNFEQENSLLYTAIHEFAHHVHFTSAAVPMRGKAHTTEFRGIFHRLLRKAEELGIYQSIFETHPEFQRLTRRIRMEFLTRNGELMKEFGQLLLEAQQLCERNHARFEDYAERVLSLQQNSARSLMKVHAYDLDPSIGYDNMRTVAAYGDEQVRKEVQEAFKAGQSKEMIKAELQQRKGVPDPLEKLTKEKSRIEKTITTLTERLQDLEDRIRTMETRTEPV